MTIESTTHLCSQHDFLGDVPDQQTSWQAGFRAKSGQFQAGKRSLVDLDSPDFVTGKADLSNTRDDILDRMFFCGGSPIFRHDIFEGGIALFSE